MSPRRIFQRRRLAPLAALAALPISLPVAAQEPPQPEAEEVEAEVAEQLDTLSTTELDPLEGTAPLTEITNFGVEWPDMDEVSDRVTGEAADAPAWGARQRYSATLNGLGELEAGDAEAVRAQFAALSLLEENDGEPAVIAQIDRRAEADVELMRQVLRSHGYYDARVVSDLVGGAGTERIEVVFEIEPGPLYRFEQVELPGLEAAGERTAELREQFPVEEGDAADAAEVGVAQVRLATELGNRGYPFAEVGEERVVIDHADRTARLTLPVEPGGERDFGEIVVREGAEEIFGAEHVQTIARFEPGELYSTAMVDDLRRALIQTGLVSRVELEPVRSTDPELVDLAVSMEPAPSRTIAGQLGYGTGEGLRVEGSWEHRNLIRPEGAFTARGILGTEEQYASISFRRSNFVERDHVLSLQLFAGNINRDAYDARTAGFTAGLERVSNQLWQKEWTWSVGTQLLASDERDFTVANGGFPRRTFFIAALPLSLGYDGTNDLLNPEQGFRVSAFVSPELSLQGGTFGYARIRLDGSAYLPVSGAATLAGRVRIGSIPGSASVGQIAPSRRFYVGGGGSVRGYSYQAIGPRDFNNDPIGGRSMFETALELRYRFGQFGVVTFIDAGALYTTVYPTFDDLRFGAGIGLRYYSSFGPIRIDVGTPINPQPGDPVIAVYVSLGQAF